MTLTKTAYVNILYKDWSNIDDIYEKISKLLTLHGYKWDMKYTFVGYQFAIDIKNDREEVNKLVGILPLGIIRDRVAIEYIKVWSADEFAAEEDLNV